MSVEAEAASAASSFAAAKPASRGRTACRFCSRLQWLKRGSLVGAAVAGVVAAGGFARLIAGSALHLPPGALAGLGLLALAAAAVAGLVALIETRLELLGQALDATTDAQLIAGANGRTVVANRAFEELCAEELCAEESDASLASIEQRIGDPASLAMLRLLREEASAGGRTGGTISLRGREGAQARRFDISVEACGAAAGYRVWSLRECAGRPGEPAMTGAGCSGCAGAPEHRAAAEREQAPAVSRSREHFHRFFANAPVGIAVVSRSGRFIEANHALGELLEAAPDALTGRELIGFLKPEDCAAVAAKLADAADGREDRAPLEIRMKSPSERTMVLLLSPSDMSRSPGGDANAALAMAGSKGAFCDSNIAAASRAADPVRSLTLYFIDVTEQKHLEAQFAQSQKMQAVGQLAGGVAHDFNNLLTAMIGFCDLLLLRSRPGDPAFADIMQIKQNANRAANLVRQLLAFSRQQSLQPRVLDITDVLVELAHLLRRLIGENIELEFAHGRDLGLVKVDQGQLEQVVINLAVNARDAMPEGGRLTIRTANAQQARAVRRGHETLPAGEYVLIEVVDTGTGVAPDHLARIFEPFFSTKKAGSGTGLGLSTVYGIVKQTGGFVFVDSAPGRGTAFAIYLPRHQAAPNPNFARADIAEPAVLRDLTGTGTVMLVEDDDAVRMFGARALRNKGYRVVEARSGEAALELIRDAAEPIDLVVTDVVMPQMDGPALIREVRNINPDIKVIFISGYTEDTFRARLDSDSDIHFLPKPFSLKQLAVKVKDVISGDFRGSQLTDCASEQTGYTAGSASRCAAAPAVK